MTKPLKRYPALLALLAPLLLAGCGPGFPIMTAEQETLVKNVDRLVADNESMKARVAALESGGGGAAELKKEIEDVKRSLAETNISIEKLRGEMTFVQGSVEEEGHGREGLKESIKSISSSVSSISERVASVEGSLRGAQSDIGSLKNSLDAETKNAAEVKEAVASLGKRFSSAEAAPKAPEPAVARGGEKDSADPDAVYMKGYKETVNKDYTEAAETFRGFLVSYPNHKLASNAQYWLGEIYYARGDWEMAIIEFDKVVKKYPNGEKAAASMLKEGFAFEKLGSKKEARVLLKEVIERFPKSSEAHMAKKRLESLK